MSTVQQKQLDRLFNKPSASLVSWRLLGDRSAIAKLGHLGGDLVKLQTVFAQNLTDHISKNSDDVPRSVVSFVGELASMPALANYPSESGKVEVNGQMVTLTTLFLPIRGFPQVSELMGNVKFCLTSHKC